MSNKNSDYTYNSYDWNALSERLKLALGRKSFRSIAMTIGLSDSGLKRYFNDGTVPPIDKALDLSHALGVDFLWLCTGQGFPQSDQPYIAEKQSSYSASPNDDDIVWIDSIDVFASAGNGYINDDHNLSNKLPFSQRWLSENGLAGKKLSLIRVSGDSMEPTLFDKDTPLVELLPDDFVTRLIDDVYVLRINGQLLIKRIQRHMGDGFLIKSDNPRYDSFHLTKDNCPTDFKIIARWTGKKF